MVRIERMIGFVALTLVLSSIPVATGRAADFFVAPAPGGSDASGTGTIDKPFSTISKGLDLAQPGDRVLLRAGDYRLIGADGKGTLNFPRDGEQGKPITLAAYQKEYVALLGSVRLTGWQKYEGNIWKIKHPARPVKGLYEDAVRLTHPRLAPARENPPVSELRGAGMWTQDADWVYLWTREGDTPDNHRIEASQAGVVNVNKSWIRVEGLRMFFGQNTVCEIEGDHSEVIGCEIAHCSNSEDNSYAAYFSGCSNSAYRDCIVYDSYYWGDHGSNSHLISVINCGFDGPNFVDGCNIFDGGLGVGSKGAAKNIVVINSRIHDVVKGVSIDGERSSGPGAGKTDVGHYLVYHNRFVDCGSGIFFHSGDVNNNRFWNNLFEKCDIGVMIRDYRGEPKGVQIVNNIFLDGGIGVQINGGRKGDVSMEKFIDAGLHSHTNLYWGNKVDWQNPLNWSKYLDMSVTELHAKFPTLGDGSFEAQPKLDKFGRSTNGGPALGRGSALVDAPDFIPNPKVADIGLGAWGKNEAKPDRGLTLSIAGSSETAVPAGSIPLKAAITNQSAKAFTIPEGRDAIVTYHFGYRGWHMDAQEIHRVRVALPATTLKTGDSLDLTTLDGWKNPVDGAMGSAFHLRTDEKYGNDYRLWATVRFVDQKEQTAEALQQLVPLIWSDELVSGKIASEPAANKAATTEDKK